MIETARLFMRGWELGDIPALIELSARPGMTEFSTGSYRDMDAQKAARFIEREQSRFTQHGISKLAVFDRASSQLLGVCGLFEMPELPGAFEINYRFPSDNWGRGYGSESARGVLEYGFRSLGFPKLYAVIDPVNARSQGVARKIGMRLESELETKNGLRQLWCADA